MKTIVVPISEDSLKLPKRILKTRQIAKKELVDEHGSGTLKLNTKLGFSTGIQLDSEVFAYIFGYAFSFFKTENITIGESISECDEEAYTLTGRYFHRFNENRLFREDKFSIRFCHILEDGESVWEGICIVVEETSYPHIRQNSLIAAPIYEYDTKKEEWKHFINFDC